MATTSCVVVSRVGF